MTTTSQQLGREAFERRNWTAAYSALVAADAESPLAGDDLERLAMSAQLIGQTNAAHKAYERAYEHWLTARILSHLGIATEPIAVAPARAPPPTFDDFA